MSAPERIWIEDERTIGGRCHVHTQATEGVLKYATEYRRADLPPTDAEVMNHPKVKALVEALREYACNCREGVCEGQFDCGGSARAALAAIQEEKTND